MKNALRTNLTTPVLNLGRWRPMADLKKDKTLVLACGPTFGPDGNGHTIIRADIAELHGAQYWQPLDAPPRINGAVGISGDRGSRDLSKSTTD